MGSTGQPTWRIEALRALMDRLVSPDLTLGEAKGLRCRLLILMGVDLEESDFGLAPGAASSIKPCEGRQDGPRSPGCRDFAA